MPKRDNDLLRELLLRFEASDYWLYQQGKPDESQSPQAASEYYHLLILCDAGLLEMTKDRFFRLTSSGFDYIETVREKSAWERTKDAVAETGGSATIEITKALATGFLKKKISQHTGIEL